MAFLLSYALKTQHPLKASVNADMTFNTENFIGVFDGVGGVENQGLRPEDLSYDMRANVKDLLCRRFRSDARTFDLDLLQEMGYPAYANTRRTPGQWMHDLFVVATLKTQSLGSTTMIAASLNHGKLAYFNLGDCFLRVYRPLYNSGGLSVIHMSRELGTVVRDAHGLETRVPHQLAIYDNGAREISAHNLVGKGEWGVVKVQTGDIVVMGSDGVSDNVDALTLRQLVSQHFSNGADPKLIAQALVGEALRANKKPDDTSIVVAFVQ